MQFLLAKLPKFLMENFKGFKLKENECLKNYCTFKIGGNAKYLFIAHTNKELIKVCKLCKSHNIKYKVIGLGANLVFDDLGYNGAIIINKTNNVKFKGTQVITDGGVNLTALIMQAYQHGLSGLENLSGIPSTLAGGIVNNAGAFKTEIADCVENVECFDENFNKQILNKNDCQFEYRNSLFKRKNLIITRATLKFSKCEKSLIKKRIDEAIKKKSLTQPLNYPSAGSIFKRCEIIPAKVIDELGLKGTKIGGAEISTKHAGFIVNLGSATSQDVKQLINLIKEKVKSATNEDITPEIEFVEY